MMRLMPTQRNNILFSSPIPKIANFKFCSVSGIHLSEPDCHMMRAKPSQSGSGEAFLTLRCTQALVIAWCVGVVRKKRRKHDRSHQYDKREKNNASSLDFTFLLI